MARKIFPALLAMSLAACADSQSPSLDAESKAVVEAYLASQPDAAAEWEEFAAEYPEDVGILSSFFDHRICVANELAGTEKDFLTAREISPLPSAGVDVWSDAADRTGISSIKVPDHVRRDNSFALCGSGVLQMTHPTIEQDTARIFVTNECSGWCGWGGIIHLQRYEGAWRVERQDIWWAA